MNLQASSTLQLAPLKAMRSFTMKRLMIFVGFSVVGPILAYTDALLFEQEVVMAIFILVGFMASLVVEDRTEDRFPILMHAVYAYSNSTAGEGVVEDVSMSGCKVRSTTPATLKAELRLQFYPSGEVPPIEIQKAFVRWTKDGQFGVQFDHIEHEQSDRLRHLISELSAK
jgi:PilZ domain